VLADQDDSGHEQHNRGQNHSAPVDRIAIGVGGPAHQDQEDEGHDRQRHDRSPASHVEQRASSERGGRRRLAQAVGDQVRDEEHDRAGEQDLGAA
jgi:hypothetical protein